MVRLLDAFPDSGEAKPQKRAERPDTGLPEVLIFTVRHDIVDLVRAAVEEAGYRLHHVQSADEVRLRLKTVGRIVVVIDGTSQEAVELALDPEIAARPHLVLASGPDASEGLLSGIPPASLLTEPIEPTDLLSKIQSLTVAGQSATNGSRQVFSGAGGSRLGLPVNLSTEPGVAAGLAGPTAPDRPRQESTDSAEVPETTAAPEITQEGIEGSVPAQAEVATGSWGSTPEAKPERPSPKQPARAGVSAPKQPAKVGVPAPGNPAYEKVVETVCQFMRGHRAKSNPPLNEVAFAVEALIAESQKANHLYLEVIHHVPAFDDVDLYLAHHQVNTAVFCQKIGAGLGFSEQKMFEVTLAAAVHDVGMTRLPEGLVGRRGKLDQSGYSQIKQHPGYGREAMMDYGSAYPFLPIVAYQEHERFDGSGYPEGVEGDTIHQYARIVGLVDTYEALTHSRPFRESMIPFNVLQQLMRLGGKLYHSDLVKTLIEEISVFPLGSHVRLNTGEVCEVMATNEGYPLRPFLQVLFASDGSPLEQGRQVDLKDEPMVYITGPVDLKELQAGE
jgi:HD-GYP domain-containing protein (c-di-GMP phosphodiesterase class II)